MALVLSDLGADQILKSYFNKSQPVGGNNLTLKLYTTNITPNPNGGDTAAAYNAAEAAGPGYAAITLTAGSWTVTPANDPSDAVYAQQTFTFTGPLTSTAKDIYGYYVVDADGILIWAEKASGPFTPANNGDTYKITPKFQMSWGVPAA
jgi:hypothetical protein